MNPKHPLNAIAIPYVKWLISNSHLSSNYNDYNDMDRNFLHSHYQRYLAMLSNLTLKLIVLDTSRFASRFLKDTCNKFGYIYAKLPDIDLYDDSINSHPGPSWHKDVSMQIKNIL